MRNNERTPRLGMIVALGAAIVAIWLVALYGTYEDAKKEKYDVGVRPGAVTYGTHSSAVVPMVSSPMHSTSAPMISAGAIRSYAYQGHATMLSTTTGAGFKLHTTSSATVHTLGSGGGSGSIGSASGSSSSSRGITYGGASVSMPTFALMTPTYASENTALSQRRGVGPRRVHEDGFGGYEGDYSGEYYGGQWWSEDDGWVDEPFEGCVKNEGGLLYRYEGGEWVLQGNQGDPSNTPLGATPWFLMLFLAIGYGIVKVIRKKQNAI